MVSVHPDEEDCMPYFWRTNLDLGQLGCCPAERRLIVCRVDVLPTVMTSRAVGAHHLRSPSMSTRRAANPRVQPANPFGPLPKNGGSYSRRHRFGIYVRCSNATPNSVTLTTPTLCGTEPVTNRNIMCLDYEPRQVDASLAVRHGGQVNPFDAVRPLCPRHPAQC